MYVIYHKILLVTDSYHHRPSLTPAPSSTLLFSCLFICRLFFPYICLLSFPPTQFLCCLPLTFSSSIFLLEIKKRRKKKSNSYSRNLNWYSLWISLPFPLWVYNFQLFYVSSVLPSDVSLRDYRIRCYSFWRLFSHFLLLLLFESTRITLQKQNGNDTKLSSTSEINHILHYAVPKYT